jgi:hypothetical protein
MCLGNAWGSVGCLGTGLPAWLRAPYVGEGPGDQWAQAKDPNKPAQAGPSKTALMSLTIQAKQLAEQIQSVISSLDPTSDPAGVQEIQALSARAAALVSAATALELGHATSSYLQLVAEKNSIQAAFGVIMANTEQVEPEADKPAPAPGPAPKPKAPAPAPTTAPTPPPAPLATSSTTAPAGALKALGRVPTIAWGAIGAAAAAGLVYAVAR